MKSAVFVRSSFAVLAALLLAAPSRAGTIKVPADFPTIQEAVNAAVNGDVVQVSKGTYPETVTISTSNIALRGKGATIDARYGGDCVLVHADAVEVSGFTLRNGGTPALFATPGDGTPAGGLHVVGADALISKLEIVACQSYGIWLEGSGVVDKCSVDGCVGPGILVETGSFLDNTATQVTKNRVTDCGDGIVLADGPFLAEKNVCEDNRDDGLVVNIPIPFADGLQVQPTTVSKNECRRNGGNGLDLFKGTGPALAVDKNVLEENGAGLSVNGTGIQVTNCTVEGNRFGGAIVLTTDSEFSGNKVRNNGAVGVFVSAASGFADGGGSDGSNDVHGNTVQDNGGDGITVFSSSNVVEDNTVKGNLGDGVSVNEGSGELLNQILDNTVTANGHDGIDNSGGGTLISNNVTKDNGGADLAGIGNGNGTTDATSSGNLSGDGTGLLSEQELEMATFDS